MSYPANRLQSRSIGSIRGGNFFTAQAVGTGISNLASLDMLIRTPDTPIEMILSGSVAAGGVGTIRFFEDPTATADGAAITPMNHNRQSSRVATLLAFSGPTLTADGTELLTYPTGDRHRQGGLVGEGWEIILLRNEEYLVRFTNTSGSAIDVSIKAHFSEDATRA